MVNSHEVPNPDSVLPDAKRRNAKAGEVFAWPTLTSERSVMVRCGIAVLCVVIALAGRLILASMLSTEAPFLLFLGAVALASWYGGTGPGFLATFLSVLTVDFFFISPIYALDFHDLNTLYHFAFFIAEGCFISWLAGSLRRAWERNEESNRLAQVLANGIHDYALFVLDIEGRIATWNPGAERIKGYTAAEILGRSVNCFYLDDDIEAGKPERLRDLAVQHGSSEDAGWRKRKDGTCFWASVLTTALFDMNGALRGFLKITRDASEQKRSADTRRALEKEILEIAAMEQRRIGQDLHDTVGQELTALGLLAACLTDSAQQLSPSDTALTLKIAQGIKRTHGQIRELARGLIPVHVDSHGLTGALVELATRVNREFGVKCTFDDSRPVIVMDNVKATHLFHIAQEAVTNALKHSRGKTIQISLRETGRLVTLRIADDGIGMPTSSMPPQGLGLKIMRYRADLIDALWSISHAESSGTEVTCTFKP